MINLRITDVRAVPGDSAFLIDDGKTAVLYDTGFGFTGYAIAENIKKVLVGRSLDFILLTHSHYDHALGSAYLSKVFPNVKVVAGVHAANVFNKPNARAAMRELDKKVAESYGVLDYEDLSNELRVDIIAKDGDVIACGDLRFWVIGLPGHTRCSIGFFLKEEKLLLGSETLGVYFGEDTYWPACLVGYQMTLDAFRRVKLLDIERILLPHYGIVERAEVQVYLENSERITRETAEEILKMLHAGKCKNEILAYFTERDYKDNMRDVYPINAFTLNTGIMIELVGEEAEHEIQQ